MAITYVAHLIATQGLYTQDIDYIWSQGLYSDNPPIESVGGGSSSSKTKKKLQKNIKTILVRKILPKKVIEKALIQNEPIVTEFVDNFVQPKIDSNEIPKNNTKDYTLEFYKFYEESLQKQKLAEQEASQILQALALQQKKIRDKKNNDALALLLLTI